MEPNGDHQRPWPVFRPAKKLEGRLLRKLHSNRTGSVCMVLLGIKCFKIRCLTIHSVKVLTQNRNEFGCVDLVGGCRTSNLKPNMGQEFSG